MRVLLALCLVVALAFGVAPRKAEAHSFGSLGPPHTHLVNPGCTRDNCYRWILINGAVMQGPYAHLIGQWGYIGVYCSFKQILGNEYVWKWNRSVRNLWGATGFEHQYCQNPVYHPPSWGIPWAMKK